MLTSDVQEVIDKFTNEDKVFSAYDVTKEVNKNGPVARHYKIKSLVHGIFQAGEMNGDNYNRELITLDVGNDDADAFVYYPNSKTAYDHPLAKSQTVTAVDNGDGVPTLDLDDLDDDTDDEDEDDDSEIVATVTVTNENRIQIPRKVLKGLYTNDSSYHISCGGKLYVKSAEADGRIRITDTSYLPKTRVNIAIQHNTVIVN